MALTLVQGNSAAAVNVLAFASAVTAGNLLVVGAGCEGTVTSISDSLGNTWIQDAAVTGQASNLTVWHAIANSTGTCTVTVTMTASFRTVALSEFTGFSSIGIDATATAYNGATPSTVTITNRAADALLVVVVRAFHSASTFTPIAGTTMISQGGGNDATANGYALVSTAAAKTLGFNVTGGADNSPIVAVSYASPPITIRGSSITSTASSSTVVPLPAGSQIGDLCVAFVGAAYTIDSVTPAGWASFTAATSPFTWNGNSFFKVLTSGDLSTGSITVGFGGNFQNVIGMVTLVGNPGIHASTSGRFVPEGAPDSLSTSATPFAADLVIYFACNRGASSDTINRGTQFKTVTQTNGSGTMSWEKLTAGGAVTAQFTYAPSGAGAYDAIAVFSTSIVGVVVSKVNAFAVLAPNPGLNVSKTNAYAALQANPGLNVSKTNVYVAVVDAPLVRVSKANAYAVLTTPLSVNISKANAYAVLIEPQGVRVSKLNAYAALSVTPGLNVSKTNAYTVVVNAPGVRVSKVNAYMAIANQKPLTLTCDGPSPMTSAYFVVICSRWNDPFVQPFPYDNQPTFECHLSGVSSMTNTNWVMPTEPPPLPTQGDWDPAVTYPINARVASINHSIGGIYPLTYQSLRNANKGNDPDKWDGWWNCVCEIPNVVHQFFSIVPFAYALNLPVTRAQLAAAYWTGQLWHSLTWNVSTQNASTIQYADVYIILNYLMGTEVVRVVSKPLTSVNVPGTQGIILYPGPYAEFRTWHTSGLSDAQQLKLNGFEPKVIDGMETVGAVGDPYVSAIVAHDGQNPYTYGITGGSLPPGLTLNSKTGVITGTPTASGVYTFTAMVTDDAGTTATITCGMSIECPKVSEGGGAATNYAY